VQCRKSDRYDQVRDDGPVDGPGIQRPSAHGEMDGWRQKCPHHPELEPVHQVLPYYLRAPSGQIHAGFLRGEKGADHEREHDESESFPAPGFHALSWDVVPLRATVHRITLAIMLIT
jgi:hypothetical protein